MKRTLMASLLGLSLATGMGREESLPIERYAAGHPVQERFLADNVSKRRVLICGRRTGKTVALIIAAVLAMQQWAHEPDVWVVYISKTAKLARKQFWRPLKRMLAESRIAFSANETEMTLELASGGGLMLGGADDIGQIEKFRGYAVALAIIDECGTYPSNLLQALVEDVLEPATADIGGRLVFGGTPGPTLIGYWYDMSGPTANDGVYRGDLRSNPHIRRDLPPEERPAAIEAMLAEIRERNGWSETHPTYVREWLGLWAQDDEALVFPLAANANYYAANDTGPFGLPAHTESGFPLPQGDWRVVIGIDVGVTQSNAFVVCATHPSLKRSFVLHVEKHVGQLLPAFEARVEHLRRKFAIDRGGRKRYPILVIDAGGMGKVHAETLRRKAHLRGHVEAAEKREKLSAISITRDEVMSGRVALVRWTNGGEDPTTPLADEWHVLVWNEKRDGIADGQEDHATDAALYALRRLRDNTKREPDPGPKEGSKEWYDEKEQKLLEEHKRRATPKRRKGVRIA